jgi:hypothetical protein
MRSRPWADASEDQGGPADSASFARADASLSSSSSMTNTVGGAPGWGHSRGSLFLGRVK